MRPCLRYAGWVTVLLVVWASPALAEWEVPAYEDRPRQLEGSEVTEHLGVQLPLDLPFTDANGQPVVLGDYFGDDLPVLLTLNYYECPSLCTTQLNGLATAMREVDGSTYRVVTVSIDPDEGPALAREKSSAYQDFVGRDDLEWHFLVGDQPAITTLAETVGFSYRYDEETDQFAHRPVAYVISPTGTLTRYLYGILFEAEDLTRALREGQMGIVADTVDRVLLNCFHYIVENNAAKAFNVMRLGGILVAAALGMFLVVMWRRDRRRGTETTS